MSILKSKEWSAAVSAVIGEDSFVITVTGEVEVAHYRETATLTLATEQAPGTLTLDASTTGGADSGEPEWQWVSYTQPSYPGEYLTVLIPGQAQIPVQQHG